MSSEVIFVEPGHTAFALCAGRVMVQVRSGVMNHPTLDACERLVIPRLRGLTDQVGAIIVLNGDAQVPPADVRARQQQLVGTLLDESGAFMVSVVEGTSIQASSLRTVTRVLVMGKPRLVHRPDVESAASWLAGQTGVAASDLAAAVEMARAAIGPARTSDAAR